jgi:hypothetical protein
MLSVHHPVCQASAARARHAAFDETGTLQGVWRLYAALWEATVDCTDSAFRSNVAQTAHELSACLERERQQQLQLRLGSSTIQQMEQQAAQLEEEGSRLRSQLHEAHALQGEAGQEAALAERRAEERITNYQKLLTDERHRVRDLTGECPPHRPQEDVARPPVCIHPLGTFRIQESL